MKTTWLVRTLGTLGFGAIAVRLARKRLLDACNHERAEVLKRDYGYLRPDPGKLIREGIGKATRVIEAVPTGTNVRVYLDEVARQLEACKEQCRRNPISDDGWADEDGYILGGITAILNAV